MWQLDAVHARGVQYAFAVKEGMPAHSHADASALLLAEHVDVAAGDTLVHLNCGNGLLAAAAHAAGAARVIAADRNIVAVEAASRTLRASGYPAAAVLHGHGGFCIPEGTVADAVAIRIPREKPALRQLLLDAFQLLGMGGRCAIAGANNEGARSAARIMGEIFGDAHSVASRGGHRIVAAVRATAEPAHVDPGHERLADHHAFAETQVDVRGHSFTLFARPGVFSSDHLDEGSALLAECMRVEPGESVVDIGCGSGVLGTTAALLSQGGRIVMLDADSEAVRSAARTAERAAARNVSVKPSDGASAVHGEQFDVVVTNPPFHVGRATELTVPLQFIRDAFGLLVAGGRMYLVANRTLPYERAVAGLFGSITTLHDGPRFKVITATKSRS